MTLTEAEVDRLEAAGHRRFHTVTKMGEFQLLNRDGGCVLLAAGRCEAYTARPDGCRFYPLILDLDSDRATPDDFCPHVGEFTFSEIDEDRLRHSVAVEERESRRRRRSMGALLVGLAFLCLPLVSIGAEPDPTPLPWEVWRDLATLAEIPDGDQVLMRSSHCPEGCARDRHSKGESRFLRLVGDEGVIFEDEGSGAITRIWMTQGEAGVSEPLDPEIWIRIVVDGTTVVQLPLPDFFDGGVTPFFPPMTLNRISSGGGNISYVPVAYRKNCRISLLGSVDAKIWFQITHHKLAEQWDVGSFTGEEDLSGWIELLSSAGRDPWAGQSGPVASGEMVLRRGKRVVVGSFAGPDVFTGLIVRVPQGDWPDVNIRLIFDGEVRVDMPLADFFAAGRDGTTPAESLLIGARSQGELYAYFPMPFFDRAVVQFSRDRRRGRRKVPVEYAIRRMGTAPEPESGLFGAQRVAVDRSEPGRELEILTARGRGKWVGLAAEIGSLGAGGRDYFEGDERVFIDGADTPQLHGTGVEDFFGGGFYFRVGGTAPASFHHALHGMSSDQADGQGNWTTGMYRLMLTDAPTWSTAVRVVLEGGPTNQTPIAVRTVAYYYSVPTAPTAPTDTDPAVDLP